MTGRLLVVCSQNVCRSPYIALALAQRRDLVDGVEGAAGGLIVASRGTSATPGEAMCEVAAQHFTTEQVEGHQSRALTASDLQRADLVLTMSVAERAAAALLYPPSRPRTFTIREALHLAHSAPLAASEAEEGTLEHLAVALNERRGLQPVPDGPRLGGPRRLRPPRTDPQDVRDRHREGSRSHRKLFTELDELIDGLSALIPRAPQVVSAANDADLPLG